MEQKQSHAAKGDFITILFIRAVESLAMTTFSLIFQAKPQSSEESSDKIHRLQKAMMRQQVK